MSGTRPDNFVVRCNRCGASVRVGDIKQLEQFKALHTAERCPWVLDFDVHFTGERPKCYAEEVK